MKHFTVHSLPFVKGSGDIGDRLLNTQVQYFENWVYVCLEIQNVIIGGCSLNFL